MKITSEQKMHIENIKMACDKLVLSSNEIEYENWLHFLHICQKLLMLSYHQKKGVNNTVELFNQKNEKNETE